MSTLGAELMLSRIWAPTVAQSFSGRLNPLTLHYLSVVFSRMRKKCQGIIMIKKR